MLLDVDKIEVAYGDAVALFEASIRIDRGQIVSVVGPNGAGKSTLVNTIAGIFRPRRGSIRMNGVDITSLPGHRICDHGIAIVPEGRRLFTGMSVLDNLQLGAYRPLARRQMQQGIDEVFSLFPILSERRHQISGSMSGGQQQMVAIGRALMARPELILMDEPSLGLAPSIVDELFRIIRSINQERGVSVLLVEQNVNKALEIAHAAYVVEAGRVVASGDPRELARDPKIREVYLGV